MNKFYFLPFLLASTSSFSIELSKTDSDIVEKIKEALSSNYPTTDDIDDLDEVAPDDLEEDSGNVGRELMEESSENVGRKKSSWTAKASSALKNFETIDGANIMIKYVSALFDGMSKDNFPEAIHFLKNFIPIVRQISEKNKELDKTIKVLFERIQNFKNKLKKAEAHSKKLPPQEWRKNPLAKENPFLRDILKNDTALTKSKNLSSDKQRKSPPEKESSFLKKTPPKKTLNTSKSLAKERWIP